MNAPAVLGRYLIFDEIGGGGMAKVHLGRVLGAAGFSRVVAIKRLHPGYANDADFVTMLVDEARLAARIRHPNVVTMLDVVNAGRELILVMEYVHGPSLAWVARALDGLGERAPLPVVVRIILDVLAGLHAAHEAKSERGRPLEMVHRDVSPHNILVGDDGVTRIVDFGIAKANGKLSLTLEGQIKGKLVYMAPEQLRGEELDRRADLFATGIVLWELLTGRKLFTMPENAEIVEAMHMVMMAKVEPPSRFVAVPPELDAVVMMALHPERTERFATAEAMATALEASCPIAKSKEVAAWIGHVAAGALQKRADLVARVEQMSAVHNAASRPPSAPDTGPFLPPANVSSRSRPSFTREVEPAHGDYGEDDELPDEHDARGMDGTSSPRSPRSPASSS